MPKGWKEEEGNFGVMRKNEARHITMLACEALLLSVMILTGEPSFGVSPGSIPGRQIRDSARTEAQGAVCDGNCSQRNYIDSLKLPVLQMEDEFNRRNLTATERREFNGVGLFFNRAEGYEDQSASMQFRPGSGFFARTNEYVIATAHTFYTNGRLRVPLDQIVFGTGDFEADKRARQSGSARSIQEFEIADIEPGTTNPEAEPWKDFVVVRLARRAPPGTAVMALRLGNEERNLQLPDNMNVVAYHYDRFAGLRPQISPGRLEQKVDRPEFGGVGLQTYQDPNVVIFRNDTNGRSSGGVMPTPHPNRPGIFTAEVLNVGALRTRTHVGNNFNAGSNVNYGIRLSNNPDVTSAFARLYARSREQVSSR